MKRHLLIFFAFMAVLLPGKAQDAAMYVYRNDGPLNAFLMERVDSMSYSSIGVDGLQYAVPVVQEIWTKDSLYRIPISVIDSIGYQTPEPIFKKNIFFIDESNVSDVADVDIEAMTITFRSSAKSLPSKGQVIFCDLEENPFPMGFSGRVTEIKNLTGGVSCKCDVAEPEEVYDRLLVVGRVGTDGTDLSSVKLKAPRKKSHAEGTYNIDVPILKNLKISGKGTITIDYTFDINVFNDDPTTCQLIYQHDMDWDFGLKINNDSIQGAIPNPKDEKEILKEYWNKPITIFSAYGLKLQGRIGGYFSYKDGFSIEWTGLKYKSTRKEEYFYRSDFEKRWNHKKLVDEGGWNFEDGLGGLANDIKVKVELASSISFGVCTELDLAVWKPNWGSLGLVLKMGPELKGSFSIDSDVLKTWYNEGFNIAAYKELSENIKLTFGIKLGADVVARAIGKEWKLVSLSTTLFPKTVTFLPKLSKPALPKIFKTDENKYILEPYEGWDYNSGWTVNNPFIIRTTASNSTIFPGPIGIDICDKEGNLLESHCSEKFTDWHWMKKNNYDFVLPQLKPQKIIVYPTFKFLGQTTMRGEPSEITIPEPMTLSKSEIEIKEGKTDRIYINGGWGYYDYEPLAYEHIAPRELKKDKEGKYYILVKGEKAGSTNVVVTDVRSGKKCSCNVTVTPTPIELSTNTLNMFEGETRTVTVYPNVFYKVVNNNPDIVKVYQDVETKISNDFEHLSTIIRVEALQIGNTIITISDPRRGHEASLYVQVREKGPGIITITPATLDFGTVMAGQTKSNSFNISNDGESAFSFTIGDVASPFEIKNSKQPFILNPNESKSFEVTCSGIEEDKEKSVFVPIETDLSGEGGYGITLKAKGDSYTEGLCMDIYPEDKAEITTGGCNFDCKIKMPWSGEMIVEYIVSDKPDMSHIVKRVRCSGMGSKGNIIRGFNTTIFGFDEPYKTFYWRIRYFNHETGTFENCSPIRSLTTKPNE